VHISKSTKKKAKRFTFTVNQEFEKVVQGCHHQHGISWLYPPIVRAFRQLHQASIHSQSNSNSNANATANSNANANSNSNANSNATSTPTTATSAASAASHTNANEIIEDEDISSNDENNNNNDDNHNHNHNDGDNDGDTDTNTDTDTDTDTFPVKLYSVEVYNAHTGKLAGGELGYAVGTLYTSLTGFSCEDSAGSVQLGALGKLLWSLGFDMWDMGMSLAYKTKLGAEEMERGVFVDTVKALRKKKLNETGTECILKCDAPRSCKELIGLSERII